MSNGQRTLAKIPVSGEITVPATPGTAVDLGILIAAALNIEPAAVYFVDSLVSQTDDFTFAYNEPAGDRFAGVDYVTKKAQCVTNGHNCFVISSAGIIVVDFIAYVEQLN